MEIKKTPKADLENKKSTWLLVGYVIVLAFMFVAFEWTKRDIKIDTSQAITDLVFEEEIIPITELPRRREPPRIPLAAAPPRRNLLPEDRFPLRNLCIASETLAMQFRIHNSEFTILNCSASCLFET